jgi:nucleoside-diphosphate-sugar epimerase
MRVLLTGATGLIGRQAALALNRSGHDVIALSRAGEGVEGAGRALAADLFDREASLAALKAADAEALVHLAWYGGPGRMAAVENIDWAATTIRLVRDFARTGGQHVVGAGSCAEYDWTSKGPFREDDRLRPQGLYGIAKARTGQMLTEAAGALGIRVAWARIFFVYGLGEPRGRLLGDLIHGLRAGETVKCTDGTQVRDFLHGADVGRGMASLLDAHAAGVFNLASGQGVRVRDLIEETAHALDAPDRVRFGALPRPEGDPDRLVADIARIRETTGFTPEFDLVLGIRDVIAQEAASHG